MSRGFTPVDERLGDYIRRTMVTEEPAVLARLREETAALPQAQMQISAEQGQFMGLLARLIQARRYLEVGTFTGYSSLAVALALPNDGELVCCDVSEEWTAVARRAWAEAGVAHKVRLHLAPATQTLMGLLEEGGAGSFDLAFIDADKANYPAYYELCLQLIRPGGLILVDNVLWSGRVADPQETDGDTQAIRALNTHVANDPRVHASLLPMGDGLLIALKA